MRLTEEQVTKMQAQGMSLNDIESIAAQKGYEMPDGRDFLQRTGDVVNKFFAGEKVGEAIGTVGGYGITAAKEKLGLVPKGTLAMYDTSMPSATQIVGDVGKGALQIAGAKLPMAGTVLGKVGQFGAIGGAAGAFEGMVDEKSAREIAYQAGRGAAIGGLIGLTFGVAEKGIKAFTSGIGKTGEKIQTHVIKPSQADFKDGFRIENVRKYGVGGNLQQTMEKTDSQLDDLMKQLNKKLAASDETIDLLSAYDKTSKKILGNKFENFGANQQIDNALRRLSGEISESAGEAGLVSIPEAQIVKRASGHMGAWQFGVPTPEATASQRVYTEFYHVLKKEIEKASPAGVREINKQMSDLIPIMNAVIRRIPIAQRNAALSLTDIVTLTGATIHPSALGLTALNLASKSGRVGSALTGAPAIGQRIANVGEGAERITRTFFPQSR